jgi:hypothetical protein
MILGICDRFHCLPSQALAEDVGVLRLLRIEELGGGRGEEGMPDA